MAASGQRLLGGALRSHAGVDREKENDPLRKSPLPISAPQSGHPAFHARRVAAALSGRTTRIRIAQANGCSARREILGQDIRPDARFHGPQRFSWLPSFADVSDDQMPASRNNVATNRIVLDSFAKWATV